MRKVLVIHGKGSGALQEEVRDYLSRDNRIASVMSAPGKLGGAGAVIVYLRT